MKNDYVALDQDPFISYSTQLIREERDRILSEIEIGEYVYFDSDALPFFSKSRWKVKDVGIDSSTGYKTSIILQRDDDESEEVGVSQIELLRYLTTHATVLEQKFNKW